VADALDILRKDLKEINIAVRGHKAEKEDGRSEGGW